MTSSDAAVFVFKNHHRAEEAMRRLMEVGFKADQFSLIGKSYSQEKPVGFYHAGDGIRAWGGIGAFLGGFWALLIAPAVFFLPGLGLVAMAGPFVSMFIGVLEGAAAGGGVSAVAAALAQYGVPEDDVIKYENALTVDEYVLMIHGTPQEAQRARTLLAEAEMAKPG